MVTGWRRAFCTSIPKDTDPQDTIITSTTSSSNARSPRLVSRFNFFSPSPCSTPPSTTPRHQTSSSSPGLFDFSCRTAADVVAAAASPTPPHPSSSSSSSTPPPPPYEDDIVCGSSSPTTATLRCRIVRTPLSNFFNRSSSSSNPSSPAPATVSRSSPSSAFSFIKNNLRLSSSSKSSKANGSKCGICSHSIRPQGGGGHSGGGTTTAIYSAVCSHAFHYPCLSHHVAVCKRNDLICPVCNLPWPIESYPTLFGNGIDRQYSPSTPNNNNYSSSEKGKENNNNNTRQHRAAAYNDDEPLMSQTPGGRFNPIPEADEDNADEEDSQQQQQQNRKSAEFQGFFVNSSTPKQIRTSHDAAEVVEVKLSQETAVVAVTGNYQTYAAVLKVKAPQTPITSTQRAPIDLVVAIDVGGGAGVVGAAVKRAMKLVISSLTSTDRLSVVAFSGSSKRLIPLRRMTSPARSSVRRIMDAIVVPGGGRVGGGGGGSCVNDALRKAAKILEDRRERNPVASMLLISDSSSLPADNNRRRRGCSFLSSTRYSHSGIPLHFLCLGGGGSSSEPSDEALGKCIKRLINVVVLDLQIQLGLASPGEISAAYSFIGRPRTLTPPNLPRFGDLYAEEEREILLEIRVPVSSSVNNKSTNQILTVQSFYKDPVTNEPMEQQLQTVTVPRPRSSSNNNQQLRSLFLVTRAAAESRRLSERGDLAGAYRLLSSAKGLLVTEPPSGSRAAAEEFKRMLDAEMADVEQRRKGQIQAQAQARTMAQQRQREVRSRVAAAVSPRAGVVDEKGEALTPTSAWKAAEKLAKVAVMRKSMNRVSDLHGFENARF